MKIPFEFDGQNHSLEGEIIQGKLWIHFQDKTWCTDVGGRSQEKRKGRKSGSQDEILAPMPGKIIKVSVTKDQTAESGQVLVIMEAMKMEYTLTADRKVTIEKVMVQSGQQVQLGQVLVTFAKSGASS